MNLNFQYVSIMMISFKTRVKNDHGISGQATNKYILFNTESSS